MITTRISLLSIRLSESRHSFCLCVSYQTFYLPVSKVMLIKEEWLLALNYKSEFDIFLMVKVGKFVTAMYIAHNNKLKLQLVCVQWSLTLKCAVQTQNMNMVKMVVYELTWSATKNCIKRNHNFISVSMKLQNKYNASVTRTILLQFNAIFD